jgi:transposase
MLSVEYARWGQTPEDLRQLAMSAPHRRTRERFLALYDVVQGSCGATCVAPRAGRHPQTVMGWLHAYNAHGPDALVYRRTGGRPPFVPASRLALARSLAEPSASPLEHP